MDKILYSVWSDIKKRCNNKNCKSYINYGGRGISICDDWNRSYKTFYNDMIIGYSKGLQIDRIDNNGNYCKSNCRWVTLKENCRNRRITIIHNSGIPLSEYAENNNLNYDHLYYEKNKYIKCIEGKKYYEKNKEQKIKYQIEYRIRTKELRLIRQKAYYQRTKINKETPQYIEQLKIDKILI